MKMYEALIIIFIIIVLTFSMILGSYIIDTKNKELLEIKEELNEVNKEYCLLRLELCRIGLREFCDERYTKIEIAICGELNCVDWRGFKLCRDVTCDNNSDLNWQMYVYTKPK